MACVLCFLIGRRIVAKCQDCSRLSCQMHPNFGPQLRCFDDYVYTSSFRFLVREKGVNIRYLILANYFNKAILVSYYIQLFRYLSFIYDIFQLLLIININIKQKYKNLFIFIFSALFALLDRRNIWKRVGFIYFVYLTLFLRRIDIITILSNPLDFK